MPRPRIQDEFTDKPMTAQQRMIARRKRDGRCIRCGEPKSAVSALYCATHEEAHRARIRERTGGRPWRAGGPGRRPNAYRNQAPA